MNLNYWITEISLKRKWWNVCLDLDFTWEKTVKSIVWELKGAGLLNTTKLGGKKKIIERSFSLFYKILQVCLKEHPHEFSRYKSPCPKLFWSRNRTSDWTWRTQEGMPNIVVALFCQFILIPTSNQWGRHFSPCHPCYAGRTKKEVNQPKSHKARRDLQGLTPPRIRLGLGGYT